MGLFNFKKKSTAPANEPTGPYKESATNLIYNLLFCDDPELFKSNSRLPHTYPYDILFSETSTVADLQKIIDDDLEPRVKALAYNKQVAIGYKPVKKELLAVIVEIGLDDGPDTLASFKNGTARYINQTGKILVWEIEDDQTSNELTKQLFSHSEQIINKIGPWDKPRRPAPAKDIARISFIVSDGLYFGEGPVDVLFSDPFSREALLSATNLLKYLTERSLEKGES